MYGRRNVENAAEIIKWAKGEGFETTQLPSDMHVTVAYSKQAVDWPEQDEDSITIRSARGRSVEPLGDNGAVVLKLRSLNLQRRFDEMCNEYGCTWDHDGFNPHLTITWDAGDLDLSKVKTYAGPVVLGPEVFEEINEDWMDNHTEKARFTLFKFNKKLGLILGWAIISKQGGEDYYDLQGDHIPEDAMLEASLEFMQKRRTLMLMHKGEKQGEVIYAWPLTTEIAKAMGIKTAVTGLMVAVKPANKKIIAAAEKGQLTGFSIGGQRIDDEDVDEAA